MNILWVKVGGMWPLNVGGRLRSFHILAELSKRHRVTLLTTHRPDENADEVAKHLPNCERVVSFPYNPPKAGSLGFVAALAKSWTSTLPVDLLKWRVPALRAEVETLMRSGTVDLVIADFLYAAANVPTDTNVPVILFEHNVEHMIWKRLAENETRPWRRAALEIEWRKVRRAERKACAQSSAVLAVSDVDAKNLQNLSFRGLKPAATQKQAIYSIPTGVDTAFFAANGTPEAKTHLVFSGAMDWYPNEDAMLFFMSEVLPLVKREEPNVTLTIVGRNPSDKLRDAGATAGVRVTGTVDDVRSFIDEGAVYIVPLRIGGGTRLKIFEALSMAKAVVSTTVGAEGLPLVDDEHYVRADNAQTFAGAVVSLLRDPKRRKALGNAGKELVHTHYSWRSVADTFERHCLHALNQH